MEKKNAQGVKRNAKIAASKQSSWFSSSAEDDTQEEDGEMKTEVGFEGDVDTMKDLRKTFAGIFG